MLTAFFRDLVASCSGMSSPPPKRLEFGDGDYELNYPAAIESIYHDHASGKILAFPDTPLGRTRALHVGAIHGHYWNPVAVVGLSSQRWVVNHNTGGTPRASTQIFNILERRTKAIHIHIHDRDGSPITQEQTNKIRVYWRVTFGLELAAVVNVTNVGKLEAVDLRKVIQDSLEQGKGTPMDSFGQYYHHSVSVDCDPEMSFRCGSTFRLHGRSTRIIFLGIRDGGENGDCFVFEVGDDGITNPCRPKTSVERYVIT
jgi:hypothetical protein